MKKIIAISVMFAMIAVAAFADTSVGGGFSAKTNLLKSNDPDVQAGGMWASGNANISWSGENAGGKLRIAPDGPESGDIPYFAIAWWKPIDQFTFRIGQNKDGDWGHNQIVGWGFTAEAKDTVAFSYETAASSEQHSGAFWGGFKGPGIWLEITPIDGLEIDLGIPMGDTSEAAVIYSNTKINFKYTIGDIGTARVAFDLNKAGKDGDLLPGVFFAFYLSAIENMGAELGVGLTASGGEAAKKIDLGIGFKYDLDDFGIKASIGVGVKDGEAKTKPIGVNLLPYYNLGSLIAYLNVGFDTVVGGEGDTPIEFFFNPYIRVPVSSGNFYAGIKFFQGAKDSKTGKKPDAQWSVPIGWQVYF